MQVEIEVGGDKRGHRRGVATELAPNLDARPAVHLASTAWLRPLPPRSAVTERAITV